MSAKHIAGLHGRSGGRMECEPNQMALSWVLNGIAHDECVDPPPSVNGRGLVNWALSRITGKWHSSNATVSEVEITLLEAGKFKRASGTKVTFALPESIKAAVATLRAEFNPTAGPKPYRSKKLRRPTRQLR